MQEIRCKSCGKLLGKFEGNGEIRCLRAGCGMVNKFDTAKKIHYTVEARKHINMKNRTTSSGITFR